MLSNSKDKKSDKTYKELREPNLYLFSQTPSNIWNLKVLNLSIKYFVLSKKCGSTKFSISDGNTLVNLSEEREIYCWTGGQQGCNWSLHVLTEMTFLICMMMMKTQYCWTLLNNNIYFLGTRIGLYFLIFENVWTDRLSLIYCDWVDMNVWLET